MRSTPLYTPGPDEASLRADVRAFVEQQRPADTRLGLGMGSDYSPEFSQALARRGWVGMSLPKEYGGSELGAVERFVVVEELLHTGAPVMAHWLADRQTGSLIAQFGSDYLKQRFLPEIAAGRCYFSAALSEPESGSDLASVRTFATKVPGGWEITGNKIWISGAHWNHFATVLLRTERLGADRHGGLSQIIVDLASPGISIRPIVTIDGEHHFNQVMFDSVFAPDEMLLGEPGRGWAQVTSELVSERAGPDRYMSVVLLLQLAVEQMPQALAEHAGRFGSLMARLATLRRMSQAAACMIDEGIDPGLQIPLIKDLGTTFEQEAVLLLQDLAPWPLRVDHHASPYQELLVRAILSAPSFSLRGGTNQILRTVIAKGLA